MARRPFYTCIWKDANNQKASCRFWAIDDQAAVQFVTLMAAVTRCELVEFVKLEDMGLPVQGAAQAGSNVQEKVWHVWKSANDTVIKVSVPGFDRAYLEAGPRTTKTDWMVGVGNLTTRNGTAAAKFIEGRYNYGLRKRDQGP